MRSPCTATRQQPPLAATRENWHTPTKTQGSHRLINFKKSWLMKNEWMNWRRRSKSIFSIGLLGLFPTAGQEGGILQWLSRTWGFEGANRRAICSVKPGPNSCPYIHRHRSLSCDWRGDSSLCGDLRRIEVGYPQDWWVNSQFKCESNQSRYLLIIGLPLFPCRIGNRTQTKFDPKEKQRKHCYFNTL